MSDNVRTNATIFVYIPRESMPSKELKADRLHPRNYPHTPTDYRHIDNPLRLVMEVKRVSQESAHRRTNGRTDERYQVHYLPASRSIKIPFLGCRYKRMRLGAKKKGITRLTFFSKGESDSLHNAISDLLTLSEFWSSYNFPSSSTYYFRVEPHASTVCLYRILGVFEPNN